MYILEISKRCRSGIFFWELVYLHPHWPDKLMLFFLTVEILDDDRIQILQSCTVAEAEVRLFFSYLLTQILMTLVPFFFIAHFFFFFSFQGHAFKKMVLAIYVCGNLTFLTMFLSAINHLWASEDLGFCRPGDNHHWSKKLVSYADSLERIHDFKLGRPGHVYWEILRSGL